MSNKFEYLAGLREAINVSLPVATATAIEAGDHVKLSSGFLVKATAAADDATFIGVALEAKEANVAAQNGKLTVSLADGISRYKRSLDAAATVAAGDTLQIASAQTLTPSASDVVAICVEGGTSVTEVTVIYKKSQVL